MAEIAADSALKQRPLGIANDMRVVNTCYWRQCLRHSFGWIVDVAIACFIEPSRDNEDLGGER